MSGRFGRVLTAMATPFAADGSLDLVGVKALATHLFDNGTDAIVAAGTTGESPTLTHDEKQALFEAVIEVAREKGRLVVCGTGTFSTADSIELTALAESVGADAALIVTPYYNKPPQRALVEHFRMIAESTNLPLIAYNIPGRTGTRIEHDTLIKMASAGSIVAVKDSTGDFDGVARLIKEAPDGFDVYSGDDWATFGFMCLGAAGVVSVASHVVGNEIAEMTALLDKGEVEAARAIHMRLQPAVAALFCTTSPIPLKAALKMLGLPGGPLRAPMFEATEAEKAIVEGALKDLGVL